MDACTSEWPSAVHNINLVKRETHTQKCISNAHAGRMCGGVAPLKSRSRILDSFRDLLVRGIGIGAPEPQVGSGTENPSTHTHSRKRRAAGDLDKDVFTKCFRGLLLFTLIDSNGRVSS
jgi:hypothetical protein